MDAALEFAVLPHGEYLATRDCGRAAREDLERQITSHGQSSGVLIDFAGVKAMTISFADEFLGRFYASLAAGDVPAQAVLLLGLNDETHEAVTVCLERRDLAAVAIIDGQPTLLSGPEHLGETYRHALSLDSFSAIDVSTLLGISPQNANNRLKRLVSAGAVLRRRIAPDRGGKEFVYAVPSQLLRLASAEHAH
jgi:hypothetical protein